MTRSQSLALTPTSMKQLRLPVWGTPVPILKGGIEWHKELRDSQDHEPQLGLFPNRMTLGELTLLGLGFLVCTLEAISSTFLIELL